MRDRRRKELGGGGDERIPPRLGGRPAFEEPGLDDDETPEPPRRRRRPEPLVTQARPQPRRPDRGRGRGREDAKKPRRRSDAARHPLILILNTLMLVLVMGLIGGVAALLIGRDMYRAPGPLPEQMAIIIDRGASVEAIATGLEERGVITNRLVFMAAAYGTGATRRLQAGEYIIPAGASMEDVLDRLVSGRVVQHSITFAEGLSSAQIVQKLRDNEILSGRIDVIPPEGSLLPETYLFTRGMTRQRLVEIMRQARDETLAQIWERRDPDLPIDSPADLVTLASIIEKETGRADERERVAAVFVNRLNRNMRLQSDPTILYGLHGGEAWVRPRTIYQSDLQRPNPYNTYQINGLPPGPIANPGRASLEAAANPAETNELFFVADGTGGHVFAVTYEQHQRNVARWREIERQRNAGQPLQ